MLGPRGRPPGFTAFAGDRVAVPDVALDIVAVLGRVQLVPLIFERLHPWSPPPLAVRRRVRVLRAPTEDSPSPPKVTLIFLMPSMDLYWNFVTAPQRVSADMTSGIPNQNPEAYEGFVEEFLLLTALCRGVVSFVLLTKIRSARGCGTMAARRRAVGRLVRRARATGAHYSE